MQRGKLGRNTNEEPCNEIARNNTGTMTEEELKQQMPLPTTKEEIARLNKQNGMDVLMEYLLDARQNYPEPYSMLEYKDAKLSTIGGIQALSGQKKNGKTFVLAQLMAAILGTDCPMSRTPQYLPGLRVPERTDRKSVV